VGEGAKAMAARRGGSTKGSSAMTLTRGRRRPPGGPAGLVGPGKTGRRRSAYRPKVVGRMGFE
jgi:hypothetical protein